MSQDVRRHQQAPLRQAYLQVAPSHGDIHTPFDIGRVSNKLPPVLRKTLDDEVSESSTRGSSPSTDCWSYAESSRSSRGTSIPPDEVLSLSGAGTSDCGCDGDYRSPRPSDDSDSPNGPANRERPELRDDLPAVRSASDPDEAIDTASSESELETDSDEDNDWSQDDGLESTVIAAVGGNLALASYLIPIIHRNRNAEYAKMIHAWQASGATYGVAQCSPGAHQNSPTFTSSSTADSGSGRGGSGPFKKRKRSNSDDFGRKDEGDDEEDGSGDRGSPGDANSTVLLLACPFHKKDPVKYSAKSGATAGKKTKSYRACAGPGWKSIQRLKEHLRRNHSPVQCSRCFKTFFESDRPSAMLKLQQHQREQQQCTVGDISQREGISEVQWAELDKKKAKRQDGERVGKWFEIWDILFPGATRPSTPFYDWASGPQSTLPSNPGKEQLMSAFGNILDHMAQVSGDLDFTRPIPYPQLRAKLLNVAGTAFDLWRSTSGNTPSEDSSTSLTKTTDSTKQSGETHQTAATSVTLPVSPVTPSSNQPRANEYHASAGIPRTMPAAPGYHAHSHAHAVPGMGRPAGMMPRSPPMAQMGNFHPHQAYYPLPTMPAAGWGIAAAPTAAQATGFEGQFMDGTGGMGGMYYVPEGWDGSP